MTAQRLINAHHSRLVLFIELALAATLVCLYSGCEKREVLAIYNWSDYLSPEIVRKFEIENGCRVIVDSFGSNEEMFAKVMSAGNCAGYDIMFPSSYQIPLMREGGLLSRIDMDKIPNFRDGYNTDYDYVVIDRSFEFSVPYSVSFCGLAYRKDCVSPKKRWTDLMDDDLKGRICLLDDMRQVLGAALKVLGHSANSTNEAEIAAAAKLAARWRHKVRRLDNDQYKRGILTKEFYLVHGYSNDIAMQAAEDDNIVFFLPEDGYITTCDEIVITSSSKNKELAHKFINFLYEPRNCAENIDYIRGSMPNTNAHEFVSAEVISNRIVFPPREVFRNSEILLDVGSSIDAYSRAWDLVISGKAR